LNISIIININECWPLRLSPVGPGRLTGVAPAPDCVSLSGFLFLASPSGSLPVLHVNYISVICTTCKLVNISMCKVGRGKTSYISLPIVEELVKHMADKVHPTVCPSSRNQNTSLFLLILLLI